MVVLLELMLSMLLCMDLIGENLEILGIKIIELIFGLFVIWINKD